MDPRTKSISESHSSDSPIAGDRHSAEESVAEMTSVFGLDLRLNPSEDDTGDSSSQSNSDMDQIASDPQKEEQKDSDSEKEKRIGSDSLGDEQNNSPNPAYRVRFGPEYLASFHPTQAAMGRPRMSRTINPGFTQASGPVGGWAENHAAAPFTFTPMAPLNFMYPLHPALAATGINLGSAQASGIVGGCTYENVPAALRTRSTHLNPTYHARNAAEYLESFHPGQPARNRPGISQRTNPRFTQASAPAGELTENNTAAPPHHFSHSVDPRQRSIYNYRLRSRCQTSRCHIYTSHSYVRDTYPRKTRPNTVTIETRTAT